MMSLFDRILAARGINEASKDSFFIPDYSKIYDPFLLPDMDKAVRRLVVAREKQEQITIYGDYDIDGLTASTLIKDAFSSFGYNNIDVVIPNRFIEGFGLTIDAVENIAKSGSKLIVTVDCGSNSIKEIKRANELGLDVVVTDHHNVADTLPQAVAVVNPKRTDNKYPFIDLAGVGVAFKLVQALQTKLLGLPYGQEKWLLDLVALGTVCDVVTLLDENRTFVYWGLKVLSNTRRPGLRALIKTAGVNINNISTNSIGFGLGPRMNAAGRLETAQHSLDMLLADNMDLAIEKAKILEEFNLARKSEQAKIFKQSIVQAEFYSNDPVLVISSSEWNHGIVGIVAAKLLEKYKKPAFVLQEMGDETKGSARSYGDFSAVEAVKFCSDIISKGGGHTLAAGVTLPTKNIAEFRYRINNLYRDKKLVNQKELLLPKADTTAELKEITIETIDLINKLEPFGNGNPKPIIRSDNLLVINVKKMGSESQHVKLELQDSNGVSMVFIAFGAPDYFFVEIGSHISVWYQLEINEWQGRQSVEGKLLHLNYFNSCA